MQEKGYENVPWITKKWSIVIVICIAFFVIVISTFYSAYQHFDDKKTRELNEDKTVANLISIVINERQRAITGTLLSYASRPLVVKAAKNKSFNAISEHLDSLKKSDPGITSVFVTDKTGTMWAINPLIKESMGKNYAHRDWYIGLSKHWKPYVSDALQRTVKEKDVVVFVCTPVIDEKGEIISIIGVNQRAVFLSDLAGQFRLNPDTTITIIDRVGNMIYSDRPEYEEKILPYPFFSLLRGVSREDKTIEAKDPAIGGGISYLSFARMKDTGWTVVVSRDRKSLIKAEYEHLLIVFGMSFLLFLLAVVSLIYIRNRIINRQLLELLQVEEALKESEHRLNLTLDAANEGIWDWDFPTGKAIFSPHYYTMLGYEPYEFPQNYESWRNIVHPDDVERVEMDIQKSIAAGKGYSVEFRMRTKSGGWKWILSRGNVVERDADGKPLRILGTHTDIDNLKHAEMEILKTRNYLENLIDYANAPIIVWDTDFHITLFNHAFERLTGVASEEVLGKKIDMLFPGDRREECIAYIHKTLTGERWEVVEIPILHKDGSVRIVLWNSATLYDQGSKMPVATIAQGQDITERKQIEKALQNSEERWKDLFARTSNAIAVYDVVEDGEDFVFKDFNPAGERIENVKRDDIIGHCVTEIFPGVKEFGILDVFKKVWRTGIAEHHDINFYKDNRIQGWRDNYVYKLNTGEIVAVYEDMTASKKAEEEILMLNAELEQRVRDRTAQLEAANRELEAFAYSVSHDLRAPLRGVDGFSHILLEDYKNVLDEKGKDYLNRIRAGSQRLGELIDDLLKLSRVSRAEIRYEKVDLSSLGHTIAEEFKKTQPERNVEFAIEDNITGRGDPNLLKIALQNILNNALKFTRHNAHAKIEFYTARHDGEKVYCIRDNGVGFEMEFADKLFGAFQRLHARSEFEGTGIGLATVQRIIHKHGGRIWAEAEVGKGATFYFTLQEARKTEG